MAREIFKYVGLALVAVGIVVVMIQNGKKLLPKKVQKVHIMQQ